MFVAGGRENSGLHSQNNAPAEACQQEVAPRISAGEIESKYTKFAESSHHTLGAFFPCHRRFTKAIHKRQPSRMP